MRKILLFIIISVGLHQELYAQTNQVEDGVVSFSLPFRNSLKFNRFVINPTFSFVREQNTFATIYSKRQWLQFNDAPTTYVASYSGRFLDNEGIGIGVFQHNIGVLTTFGGIVNFTHNVELEQDSNLTFGLNLGAYKSGLNAGKVITNGVADPSLNNIPSNFLLTVSPGINYGTAFLDFGVAFNNMITYNFSSAKMLQDDLEKGIQAHVMYTGYLDTYGLFDKSKFSALIRSEFKKEKTILSGTATFATPLGIWAQAGYNSLYGLSGGIGMNITPTISLEYITEKGLSGFSNFGFSHEIVLAYKFKSKNYYHGDDEETAALIVPNVAPAPKKSVKTAPVQPKQSTLLSPIDKANLEAARKEAQAEREQLRLAKLKEIADAKAKADADAKAKLLANEAAQKAAIEAERLKQAKLAADAKLKAEAATKAKTAVPSTTVNDAAEKARLAKLATDAKAKADAEAERLRKEKLAAEAKAKVEADAKAKAAADAERLRQEKLAAEAKAKADAEEKAKVEVDAKAKAAADAERLRQEKLAAESKAKADAEAKAKLEADAKAKAAADAERLRQEKLAAEAKAKADAEAKAKVEADAKAKAAADAERLRQEKLAAEAKAKADAKAKEIADAEAKAKVVADAKAKATADAERLRQEKLAAEAKAKADAKAKEIADAEAKAKLEADAKAKAAADAERLRQEKLAAKAKEIADAEAKAKLEADTKAKAAADAERLRQEKLATEAKAKADAKAKEIADAEAKAKLEADTKAKAAADAERLRQEKLAAKAKEIADAEAKAKLEADTKAKAAADAERLRQEKLAAEAKAKADAKAKEIADAEAKAKVEADAKAKAAADAERLRQEKLAAEAKAKADAEAKAKVEADAKAKAAAEAERLRQEKLAAEAKAKADAEAKAKVEADAKAKTAADAKQKSDAEAERIRLAKIAAAAAVVPVVKDASAIAIDDLAKQAETSSQMQKSLIAQLDQKVAAKAKELRDMKEENDLSEQGIFKEPQEIKSTVNDNAVIESLKSQISAMNKMQEDNIVKIKNLFDERIKKGASATDALSINYLKSIDQLKAEQAASVQTNTKLVQSLENIKVAVEVEKKRRIKRANSLNSSDRLAQDQAALKRIKETTKLSATPLTVSDFDFGEEQSNMQIMKRVENTPSGYYMIMAVHKDVAKRDAFLTKAVASGMKNVSFYYDASTSSYYIYNGMFDNLQEAQEEIKNKTTNASTSKMVIIKVEN
ncbi:type IX secretion system membrane protein, PorP/SprF family [Flavobacterium succinicans]|uniref:Type IX secretion system membrane protein, PorP/SprF family n=2 Tax=Flavobacterium succinicans TaxID=29536 RepID=A0A1I4R6W7_9FLAO|nr:type IX secretion system membrane protein PorP/SprF [Flavobacterium succinicans]SFM47726.1 type IX secretion system membrane protein, PorP/SprF family [Flavobacterium succinicans]